MKALRRWLKHFGNTAIFSPVTVVERKIVDLRVHVSVYCHEPALRAAVAEEWQVLERFAQASFFLSWAWIETWLDAIVDPDPVLLSRVYRDDELVGLAFVGVMERRILGKTSRIAFFNELPVPGRDITQEKNGCLAVAGSEAEVFAALCKALLESEFDIEELCCRGIDLSFTEHLDPTATFEEEQRRCWLVGKASAAGALALEPVLSSLSRNRRAQLKRSFELMAKECGSPMTITAATTQSEADRLFQKLEQLHTRYWQSRGGRGVFANPRWRTFHWLLVSRLLEKGGVQLLEVAAGDRLIGVVYNLRYRSEVLNIQSGFNYTEANWWRPGYVAHLLAADHAARHGCSQYDLLMGSDDYKSSIARPGATLTWFSIYSPGRLNRRRMVRCLLELYRRVRSSSKPKAQGDSRS